MVRLESREQLALRTWNSQICFYATSCRSVQQARYMAFVMLDDTAARFLSLAFRSLYPHWFTNGRRGKTEGDIQGCREVCRDIINKLNLGTERFADITRLFNLSGDGAMATGRRPLASVGLGQKKVSRTSVRIRNTQCKFHPNKKAVSNGLCITCYSRGSSLASKGIYIETFTDEMLKEVMLAPRPTRKEPLWRVALDIIVRHKKMEDINEQDSTATA